MRDIASVITLTCAFLGCYTYYPQSDTEFENEGPSGREHARVYLIDGSALDLEPYHHVNVSSPSDLILGSGTRFRLPAAKEEWFSGTFVPNQADSMRVFDHEGLQFARWYMKDSTLIQMEQQNSIRIRPEDGVGLWVLKAEYLGGAEMQFTGKISYDRITGIEVQRFSQTKTLLFVSGYIVAGVLIGLALRGTAVTGL